MNIACKLVHFTFNSTNIGRTLLSKHLVKQSLVYPNFTQERDYAARKGKRAAVLAAKLARKLTLASQPKPPPKNLIRKVKIDPEKEKKRVVDENWEVSRPIDDVWRTALYRGKPCTFQEALSMHRQTHHSSMLDMEDSLINATIELDLRLKKKEQYLDFFSGVLTYPHEYQVTGKNRIIVLCKDPELQAKVIEMGAVYSGSGALIKQILSGAVSKEEFDYIICHPDCLKECASLRGVLKKNYPSTHNNLLRLDVEHALVSFINGIKYTSTQSTAELDFGWVNVSFGRLNMPTDQLEDNFKFLMQAMEKHKPSSVVGRGFVTKSLLWCQMSTERFIVPHSEYLVQAEKNEPIESEES